MTTLELVSKVINIDKTKYSVNLSGYSLSVILDGEVVATVRTDVRNSLDTRLGYEIDDELMDLLIDYITSSRDKISEGSRPLVLSKDNSEIVLDERGGNKNYLDIVLHQFKPSGKWYTEHKVRIRKSSTIYKTHQNLREYIEITLPRGMTYVSLDDVLEFPFMHSTKEYSYVPGSESKLVL